MARTHVVILIHHLLRLEALQNKKINVLGIELNGHKHNDKPKTIEKFSYTKVLSSLPIFDEVNAKVLSQEWNKQQLEQKLKKYI